MSVSSALCFVLLLTPASEGKVIPPARRFWADSNGLENGTDSMHISLGASGWFLMVTSQQMLLCVLWLSPWVLRLAHLSQSSCSVHRKCPCTVSSF